MTTTPLPPRILSPRRLQAAASSAALSSSPPAAPTPEEDTDPRKEKLDLRVTAKEKTEILNRAKRLKQTPSQYLRTSALAQKIVPLVDKEPVKEMLLVARELTEIRETLERVSATSESHLKHEVVRAVVGINEVLQSLKAVIKKVSP